MSTGGDAGPLLVIGAWCCWIRIGVHSHPYAICTIDKDYRRLASSSPAAAGIVIAERYL